MVINYIRRETGNTRLPHKTRKMKRILFLLFLLLNGTLYARQPMGTSLGILGGTSEEKLAEVYAAGIRYVEVTFHSFTRNIPDTENYTEAFALRNRLEKAGLKVWSCHLPYGKKCDISVVDPEQRERNVAYIERMIRLAAIFRPQRLILHPGSRPVSEEDRSERERCSANSICRLSLAAEEIGAVLCVENMPHSIGRTSAELLRLIGDCPGAMVCFDTNHLLLESHEDFIDALGERIATIHLSDYDGTDERHWLPGKGVIDWPDLYGRLRRTGYKGVYMFEVRNGEATCADIANAYEHVIRKKK